MLANPAIQPANLAEPSGSSPDRRVPRLGRWHAGVWAVLICLFSTRAVKWVIDWENTRWRIAPTNRLVWNSLSIHTGPLAGVYYWDYGHGRPILFQRTQRPFTNKFSRRHLALVSLAMPLCMLMIRPSSGWRGGALTCGWRIAAGVAFVLGRPIAKSPCGKSGLKDVQIYRFSHTYESIA